MCIRDRSSTCRLPCIKSSRVSIFIHPSDVSIPSQLLSLNQILHRLDPQLLSYLSISSSLSSGHPHYQPQHPHFRHHDITPCSSCKCPRLRPKQKYWSQNRGINQRFNLSRHISISQQGI